MPGDYVSIFSRMTAVYITLLCPFFFRDCTRTFSVAPLFIFFPHQLLFCIFSVSHPYRFPFHCMADSMPSYTLSCSTVSKSTSASSLICFYSPSPRSLFLHILIIPSISSWFCWYHTISSFCFTAWPPIEIWLTGWGHIGLNKLLFKSFHGQLFKVHQKNGGHQTSALVSKFQTHCV